MTSTLRVETMYIIHESVLCMSDVVTSCRGFLLPWWCNGCSCSLQKVPIWDNIVSCDKRFHTLYLIIKFCLLFLLSLSIFSLPKWIVLRVPGSCTGHWCLPFSCWLSNSPGITQIFMKVCVNDRLWRTFAWVWFLVLHPSSLLLPPAVSGSI